MEDKIEFNWELYQSGNYDCVTRNGRKVEQLHRFECELDYLLFGVVDQCIESWDNDGQFLMDVESDTDLFLIQKEKEDHSPDVGKLVIPELKGVLMEVSQYEDFKPFVNREVFGKYNGRYITLGGFYSYARTIKKVKEAWVNVYQLDDMLCTSSSYKTKEEAIKSRSHNIADYIKTIRITNDKDGE